MASFLNFLSGVVGALLGTDGESGATLVLSGSGNSVTFPVAPASFDVECGYNNSVINVNSLGDINMIGKRGLKTLSFSSFSRLKSMDGKRIIHLTTPTAHVKK